jgi:hypothetical protein
VDGLYNLTNSGVGFQAAIFDQGGLYTGSESNWTFVAETPAPQPGAFYATRVSSHLPWIAAVLALPVSSNLAILQSAPSPSGPYQDQLDVHIDTTASTIAAPVPPTPQFYRLRANTPLTITEVSVHGNQLLFRYRDQRIITESLAKSNR